MRIGRELIEARTAFADTTAASSVAEAARVEAANIANDAAAKTQDAEAAVATDSEPGCGEGNTSA